MHELRYFSAGNPTKLVRDGNVEAYDEPPAQQAPSADAGAAPVAPSGVELAAAAAQPTTAYSDRAPLVHRTPIYAGPPAPRRRTGLVYSAVALVTVAAVVAFVAIEGGFHSAGRSHAGSSGKDLAASVKRSATQTLAQNTADVALQGTFSFDGTDANLRGTGQLDFAANAFAMNMSVSVAHQRIVENEIVTSQDVYFRMTVDGRSLAPEFGGRDWLESPIYGSTSQAQSHDNPLSTLRLLERSGARVVPMGAQSVGGLNCDEYLVTPAAQQQPPQNSTTQSLTIWLDPGRQLLCQLYVYVQLGTAGAVSGSATSTDTVQLLMTFTHYGVPVTIAPPPQSDTYSLSPGQGAQPA